MAVSDRTWERLVDTEVGNRDNKLYGGSQYHRTLREFHLATRCLRLPSIAEDEIANAAGIGDTHDGVNFLHAACTIALEKARVSFDPMLHALSLRMQHVFNRLGPVAEYMLRENRERKKLVPFGPDDASTTSIDQAMDISQNPQFRQVIRSIFEKFVQKCSDSVCCLCGARLLVALFSSSPHFFCFVGNVEMSGRPCLNHSICNVEPRRTKQWGIESRVTRPNEHDLCLQGCATCKEGSTSR